MNENDVETMLTAMLARLRVSADSVIESAEIAQVEIESDARGALSSHGGLAKLESRIADLQRWMDAIRTTCAAIQCQRAPLKGCYDVAIADVEATRHGMIYSTGR